MSAQPATGSGKTHLPRPAWGAFARAEERTGISASALGRIWNGNRKATADEAVRILGDHELGAVELTFEALTGVRIEVGTPLAGDIVAAKVQGQNEDRDTRTVPMTLEGSAL